MITVKEKSVIRKNKIKILIADHHPVCRQGLTWILRQQPDLHIVGQADDGKEAVKKAIQLAPDVVILDAFMPTINGIEIVKKIKARCPNTAIVIISSRGYESFAQAALEAGASGYLLRNVQVPVLIAAIKAVHNGELVLDAVAATRIIHRVTKTTNSLTNMSDHFDLHERELEILRFLAHAMKNREIADKLNLSVRTVESHIASIFNKLNVSSRMEAVFQAIKEGWLSLDDLL